MSQPTVVAVASDHAGFDLKVKVVAHLTQAGHTVLDLGPERPERCDYPDYAAKLSELIRAGRAPFGVLICGTGIGMSIAANKQPGIRAALVHDELTARFARAHNDAQVICLGSRVLGDVLALACVDAFLTAPFEGGRHAVRIAKLHAAEEGER